MEKEKFTQDWLNDLEAKWLNGTITDEEAKLYAEWYNQGHENPIEIPSSIAVSEEAHRKKIFGQIQAKLERKTFLIQPYFGRIAAAVGFIIFLISGVLFFKSKKDPVAHLENEIEQHTDINPAKQKATLTLSNGQIIELDKSSNGLLAKQGDVKIANKDGALIYDGANSISDMQYNMLITHNGEQYPIILSDGTKVWLNAASSLRFPVQLADGERKVEITGEAYFEVAHHVQKNGKALPFFVRVKTTTGNECEIQVLGTHFNINAYDDTGTVEATLLEGSIQISHDTETRLLKPSQQAQVSRQQMKIINDADIEQVMAWRNGFFQFKNANLQTVLNQLSRWYDLQIVYKGKITDQRFEGKIPNTAMLSQVLSVLKKNEVHFEIEGKKMIVLP
ncbi:MAG: DUF4974 domain-containing protein [Chitinophagaceae bacterium]